MKDKTILWVISFLLLATFVSGLFTILMNYQWEKFSLYAGVAGRLLGLNILIRMGTFIKTKAFRLSFVFISCLIVGLLLNIMHWEYGGYLLSIAFAGIPLMYTIHFSRKKKKRFLDILKLIWTILICATMALIMFHLPGAAALKIIESALFCLMFWSYTITEQKKDDDGFQWVREKD